MAIKVKAIKSISIFITIVALTLCTFVIAVLWMGLSPLPPSFIYGVASTAGFLMAILFIINLGFVIRRPDQRNLYIMVLTVIIIAVVGTIIITVSVGDRQRQWFLKSGKITYDRMVAEILKKKGYLTSRNVLLNDFVGTSYGFRIYGLTNSDGSMTIMFFGRGNSWRRGYLYYSGNQMIASPPGSEIFYFPANPYKSYLRVTNSWYEF